MNLTSLSVHRRLKATLFLIVGLLTLSRFSIGQTNSGPIWIYNNIYGPFCCAYSPDGTKYAIGGNEGVQVFSSSNQALIGCYYTKTGNVDAVAFSPDSKTLAVGGDPDSSGLTGIIEIWNVASGQMVSSFSPQASINSLAFSPNGQEIVTGGSTYYLGNTQPPVLTLWNVKSGTQLATFLTSASDVLSVVFSKDGNSIAVGGTDGAGVAGVAEIWNVASHHLVYSFGTASNFAVYAVAFSPDGKTIAVGGTTLSGKSSLELWSGTNGFRIATLPATGTLVSAAVFSPNGQTLYDGERNTAGSAGNIEEWDVANGGLSGALAQSADDNVAAIALSPDGKYLLECGQEIPSGQWTLGVTRIWKLQTQSVATPVVADLIDTATSFIFSPDSKTLITGGGIKLNGSLGTGGWLGFWDAQTGVLKSSAPSADEIWAMAASADGTVIGDCAYNDLEWRLEVRDGKTGAVTKTLFSNATGTFLDSVAVSPDGSILAVAGIQNGETSSLLQLWSTSTGNLILDLSSPSTTVADAVTFSRDGSLIAFGCSTVVGGAKAGFVQIWNVKTGQLVETMYPDEFQVDQLSFSKNGQQIVASGLKFNPTTNTSNGESEVFSVLDAEQLATLSVQSTVSFFGPTTYSSDGKLIYLSTPSGINVYDSGTYTLLTTVGGGAIYGGMAVSPNGKFIGYSGPAEIAVIESPIQAIQFSSNPVTGGSSTTVSIVLSQPAPPGGFTVLLASSSPNVTVPATIFIPAGQTLAKFKITTVSISTSVAVEISAELGGFSCTQELIVKGRH